MASGHGRGHKMQFHSWKTGVAVGSELLSPNWLAWDPAVTACALAYPDAVVICRAQPSFAPIVTLPLPVSATTFISALVVCNKKAKSDLYDILEKSCM